jgi:hypothetical protein
LSPPTLHRDRLTSLWATWAPDAFDALVAKLQQYITLTILMSAETSEHYEASNDVFVVVVR